MLYQKRKIKRKKIKIKNSSQVLTKVIWLGYQYWTIIIYCTNSCMLYTAVSREVVVKKAHVTIPKGNLGYEQYTVPGTVVVEPTFVAFLFALANIRPWHLMPVFRIFLKCCSQGKVNLKLPIIPFGIVVCACFRQPFSK